MFSNIRKAIASALGVLLTVLTFAYGLPFLGQYHIVIGIVVAILTPIATYLVPNKPKTTTPAA